MSDSLPEVYQDVYGYQKNILDLGKNIFFSDEEVDESILKTSLVGHFTECLGMSLKNGVFHRNSLRDELFINTASFDSSIYEFAKFYEVDISYSNPARVAISVAIKESDIIDYGDIEDSNIVLTIDKSSPFLFDDINFLLPNSVRVIASPNSSIQANNILTKSYSYNAEYDLTDYNLEESSITSPHVKIWTTVVDDVKWVMLRLELVQIKSSVSYHNVFTTDVNEIILFDLSFTDQLAGFTVHQKDSDSSLVYNRIEHGEFNGTEKPSGKSEYFYYSFPDEKSIQVYFGSSPDFRPIFGSSIKLNVFETLGLSGNFSYTGNINVQLNVPDEYIAAGRKKQSNINMIVKNLEDSNGGTDRKDILEIKKEIIKSSLVRDSLVSNIDLSYFFDGEISNAVTNNGKMTFIKKRDDIIDRIFDAFVLLKDVDGTVVPTNTANISIDYQTLEKKNFIIKPGTIVIYDETQQFYRLLNDNEYPEMYINNKNSFVYSIPYLLYIKLDPFPRIVYYRTDVNDKKILNFNKYGKATSFPYEVMINSINIERNSLYDNFYNFSLEMSSTLDTEYQDLFKIRMVLKDKNAGNIYGCIDLEKASSSSTQYQAIVLSDDKINSDGWIEINNSVNNPNTIKSASGETVGSIVLPEEFYIEVTILFDVNKAKENDIEIPLELTSNSNRMIYSAMKDLGDSSLDSAYGIVATFENNDDESYSLHTSLLEFMSSNVSINSNAIFLLNNIALIGTNFYSDITSSFTINRTLQLYEDILKQNIGRLSNNTRLNLKLFNTYGVSKHFSSDSTNLFIEMKIKLNGSLTSTLDTQIKTAISEFVDSINETNYLSMSNISTMLETKFSEVHSITIVGINELGRQSVERVVNETDNFTTQELIDYVPEYLSVNLEKSNGQMVPSINITYS